MPPVAAITTLTQTAPDAPRAPNSFLRDIDSLFMPAIPQLDPYSRALITAREIDWTQDTIVIWVPGTNGHSVSPSVAAALAAAGGPAAVHVRYQSTWHLADSVPDGEAALAALLQEIERRKRPGQRVVLIGESQGAWVISSILRRPELARIVDRASLLAHPALAPAHVHESTSTTTRLAPGVVREFNGEADVVTHEVGKSAEQVLNVVDSLARFNFGAAVAGAVGVAVTNFGLIQALVGSQMFRLRGEINPHDPAEHLRDAVRWILASDARKRAA